MQALEIYENVNSDAKLLVPVWIDMLADAQDFVCEKYQEKLNNVIESKPPAGLMIYGLNHSQTQLDKIIELRRDNLKIIVAGNGSPEELKQLRGMSFETDYPFELANKGIALNVEGENA